MRLPKPKEKVWIRLWWYKKMPSVEEVGLKVAGKGAAPPTFAPSITSTQLRTSSDTHLFNYFADSSLLLSNVAWINLGSLANWLSVLITPIYGIMARSNGIKMHWLLFSATQSWSQWHSRRHSPAISVDILHLSFLDFRFLSQKSPAFSTVRENIYIYFNGKQEHKHLKQTLY